MAGRLRVAVIVESASVAGWIRSVLEFVNEEPAIDLVAVLVMPSARPERGSVIQRAYEAFDRRRYGPAAGAAMNHSDGSELLLQPVVYTDGPASVSEDWLRGLHVDVVLDLHDVSNPIRFASDRVEYWHLDLVGQEGERIDGDLVPLFASRASICDVKTVRQCGTLTSELSSVVALNPASLAISRARVYERAAALFVRLLRARLDATSMCDESVTTMKDAPGSAAQRQLAHPHPGSTWVLRLTKERLAGVTRSAFDKLRHSREQWIIGLRTRSPAQSYDDLDGYTPILPPDDRMYADPFVVEDGGQSFIFVEVMPFATNRGVISVAEVVPNNGLTELRVVLECSYHLSFPFVFRDRGTWFMIPESASNGTIELYRAERFPDSWELERVLLDELSARDTIVFRARGLYWLFTTIETGTSRHDELHAFWSDQLEGPWFPHPRNPVVSDVRWARSAGQIFEDGGHLIRPAQDCSERYGGALVFRRIDVLDQHDFREETIARVPPRWTSGLHGTHTYNRSETIEVIDGARIVSTRRLPRHRSRYRASR